MPLFTLDDAWHEYSRPRMKKAKKRKRAWPPEAGVPWSGEEDKAVRKLSPAEAAKKTGRTLTAVYDRRKRLGVVAERGLPWSPDHDELLKSLTVEEAMKATGRTRYAVMRRMWNLCNSTAKERIPWSDEEDATLRRLGVHEAAEKLGRSLSATRNRWQKLGLANRRV